MPSLSNPPKKTSWKLANKKTPFYFQIVWQESKSLPKFSSANTWRVTVLLYKKCFNSNNAPNIKNRRSARKAEKVINFCLKPDCKYIVQKRDTRKQFSIALPQAVATIQICPYISAHLMKQEVFGSFINIYKNPYFLQTAGDVCIFHLPRGFRGIHLFRSEICKLGRFLVM